VDAAKAGATEAEGEQGSDEVRLCEIFEELTAMKNDAQQRCVAL
jgi:hypothetical protein